MAILLKDPSTVCLLKETNTPESQCPGSLHTVQQFVGVFLCNSEYSTLSQKDVQAQRWAWQYTETDKNTNATNKQYMQN